MRDRDVGLGGLMQVVTHTYLLFAAAASRGAQSAIRIRTNEGAVGC